MNIENSYRFYTVDYMKITPSKRQPFRSLSTGTTLIFPPLIVARYAVAALLALGAALSVAGEVINEEHDVEADGRIAIENASGSVKVVGWNKNKIQVKGELDDNVDSYTFSTDGKETVLFIESANSKTWWSHKGDNDSDSVLEVSVPHSHIVSVTGVDCDIDVEKVTGGVKLETANGDVTLSNIAGFVGVNTVNGDIISKKLSGKVKMETVSGDINDQQSTAKKVSYRVVNGNVNVSTTATIVSVGSVNGDMKLSLGLIEELNVDSVNGDVNTSLAISDDGQVNVSSVSGDISLAFDGKPTSHFNISTHVGGNIRNDLSSDKPTSAKYGPSSMLHFDMEPKSSLGGDVNISTVNGDVTLKEK